MKACLLDFGIFFCLKIYYTFTYTKEKQNQKKKKKGRGSIFLKKYF